MEKPKSSLPVAILLLMVVAGLAGAAVYLGLRQTQPQSQQQATAALIGGPFHLVDSKGRTVTNDMFRGRYMLVYFGFTYCPDICPTDLQRNARALDLLAQKDPSKALDIQPLFITVDPERDTPQAIGLYVAQFHPRLIGLTGSAAQIDEAKRAYRVYAAKRTDPGSTDYAVDHTAITYLMGRDGAYVTHFAADATADAMAGKLATLIK